MKKHNISPEQRGFNRNASIVLASVALLGAGIFSEVSNAEARIPAGVHKKAVTVEPGQGADAIIEEVEPNALGNPEEKHTLDNYIDNQGTAANHQLETGQTVYVPIIDPGHKK